MMEEKYDIRWICKRTEEALEHLKPTLDFTYCFFAVRFCFKPEDEEEKFPFIGIEFNIHSTTHHSGYNWPALPIEDINEVEDFIKTQWEKHKRITQRGLLMQAKTSPDKETINSLSLDSLNLS